MDKASCDKDRIDLVEEKTTVNSHSTDVGCEQQLKFSAVKNSFIFTHGWPFSSNHEQQRFDPTVNSSRDIKSRHP
ncbi:hypothetical protein NC653_005421 [Populus alba x Populus x berolinensis]|uniref:Uncharacterized protein n=1 Tax=Populus alba x Populus x berolinensis TaxID=444605 RepID=A0AAD6WBU6_9ROSI|nr:hypothetical protein NC653_005421 [Populus alba x Populus x berolinensis]